MQVTNSTSHGNYQVNSDNSYIMDPDNEMVSMRRGGRGNQSVILQYQDDTEWVFLNDKPQERFCGFLYLQKALKESNISTIQAAENKITIHDRKIIYLSQYCGEKKLDFMESGKYMNELSILAKTVGFTDMLAYANLRLKDEIVYVFDTEKSSFDKSVREKIDSFKIYFIFG